MVSAQSACLILTLALCSLVLILTSRSCYCHSFNSLSSVCHYASGASVKTDSTTFKRPIPFSAARNIKKTLPAMHASRRHNLTPRHVDDTGLIPRRVFLTHRSVAHIPDRIIKIFFQHVEGWDVHFYDDTDCINFLRDVWGDEYADRFSSFENKANKADFWRYAALYCYGGVYLDCDMQPLHLSLDEVIPALDATLISCIGSNLAEVFNSFLAVRPGSPALLAALDFLRHSEEPTDNLYFLRDVLDLEKKVILFAEVHISSRSIPSDKYGHRVFVQNEDGSKLLYRSRYADYPWPLHMSSKGGEQSQLKATSFNNHKLEKLRLSQ